MGKKSNAKKMRMHVEGLPTIMRNCHENHIVTGAELLRNGQTEINGEKVEVHKVYNYPMPVMVNINQHHKKQPFITIKTKMYASHAFKKSTGNLPA